MHKDTKQSIKSIVILMNEYKTAFWTGVSTIYQLFIVKQILNKVWEYKCEMIYKIFIDF